MTRITLLTDFGTADGYVAAMKGVIAAIAPGAAIDDASHDIDQGDIRAGAFTLGRYWRLYPAGTVHVVVVDPGVGGDRRAIAARVDDRVFVAPDNGVLSRVFADVEPERVVALEEPAFHRTPVSATFHGRDVFAPVAAHVASGVSLHALGPPVADPIRIGLPAPSRDGRRVEGEVVHVDRFGNLITNIPGAWASDGDAVRVRDRDVVPVRRTYADVDRGGLLALVGSLGLLEVSVRDGNAAERLGVGRGAAVTVGLGDETNSAA